MNDVQINDWGLRDVIIQWGNDIGYDRLRIFIGISARQQIGTLF